MNNQKIGKIELFFLTFFVSRALFIGISGRNMLEITKQNSWICALIQTIIGLIPILIFCYLRKNNKQGHIIEQMKNVWGKYIGGISGIIITIFVFLLTAFIFGIFTDYISTNFLTLTSTVFIGILFVIIIIYAINKGLETICRTTYLLFAISIIFFFLSMLGLTTFLDLTNFQPIINNPKDLLIGTLSTTCTNSLPLFLLLIIPEDKVVGPRQSRVIIWGYLLTSLIFNIVNFYVIGTIGIDLALLDQYPEYVILKKIQFLNFIERIETTISLQWLFDYFIFITIGTYFVVTIIKEKLKITDKGKIYKGISIFIPILYIVFVEIFFKDNTTIEHLKKDTLPILLAIFFFAIPVILAITIFIKKRIARKLDTQS